MAENWKNNDYRTSLYHYQWIFIGYNTSYDKFAITNHLAHIPPKSDAIYEVGVLKDMNKASGGSDLYGSCVCILDWELKEADNSRQVYLDDENGLDQVGEENNNYAWLEVGDTFDTDYVSEPTLPYGWFDPTHKKFTGYPPLTKVDKPVG